MELKKIGEIKAELDAVGAVVSKENLEQMQAFIDTYKVDDRGGVQKIVATAEKRMEKPRKSAVPQLAQLLRISGDSLRSE